MSSYSRITSLLLAVTLFPGTLSAYRPSATPPNPAQVVPLRRAHAHNDYEHNRPLYDALDHGFTSVEVDVHLVDG